MTGHEHPPVGEPRSFDLASPLDPVPATGTTSPVNRNGGDQRKRKIVLYGAADRYNFGDNLMPIVYLEFLKKYFRTELKRFDVHVAGIFRSDLGYRRCLPTESIRAFLTDKPSGHIVVVAGGEVVGMPALYLYSYCANNILLRALIRPLYFMGRFGRRVGEWLCRLGFEYPFVPPARAFGPDAQVCFSAVGGGISSDPAVRQQLLERLKAATHVSLRDRRMLETVTGAGIEASVRPDCVSALPDLFDGERILENVSPRVRALSETRYHVFQSIPCKTSRSPAETGRILKTATEETGVPFILLPIGYATGHKDRRFLGACAEASGLPLQDNLNVWEILWLLRCSQGYFGTSLHGAIVSLSFGRPHFIIGPIGKARNYLREWSVAPFSGKYGPKDIPALASLSLQDHSEALSRASSNMVQQALENMHALFIAAGLTPDEAPAKSRLNC